jgi:hypothetical protein
VGVTKLGLRGGLPVQVQRWPPTDVHSRSVTTPVRVVLRRLGTVSTPVRVVLLPFGYREGTVSTPVRVVLLPFGDVRL